MQKGIQQWVPFFVFKIEPDKRSLRSILFLLFVTLEASK